MQQAYHTTEDAQVVELVELSVEECDSKESCKQHLSAPHHLVDGRCDRQQAHIHQHGGHQVKEGGNAQHEDFLG